jgi:hypothetical protein
MLIIVISNQIISLRMVMPGSGILMLHSHFDVYF